MPTRFSPPRWLFPLAAGLLLLAGCEKDEIRSYTIPRHVPETAEAKYRLLGAILETGQDQWFFKLLGPVEAIGKHRDAFVKFVESVRFTDKVGAPVTWTVPAGWEKGPAGGELRFATFFVEPTDKSLSLAIFKFGQRSSLLDNVNRWCKNDLGLRPVRQSDLKQFVKPIQVDGKEASLVDMTGPGVLPGDKAPPMAGEMRRPKPLPITYTKPDDWVETGPRMEGSRGIQVPILTAFTIGDGAKKAETTVTVMPDMAVAVLAQVNRWRDQVGLRPITQEELDKKPPESIRVAGEQAHYFDFKGSEKRMMLVTVKHQGQNWYFKLLGNPEQVDNNKKQFDSFIQSVKFNGAPR